MNSLLAEFEKDCKAYVNACKDIGDALAEKNLRGRHWFMVIGVDRQMKKVSLLQDHSHSVLINSLDAKSNKVPSRT